MVKTYTPRADVVKFCDDDMAVAVTTSNQTRWSIDGQDQGPIGDDDSDDDGR